MAAMTLEMIFTNGKMSRRSLCLSIPLVQTLEPCLITSWAKAQNVICKTVFEKVSDQNILLHIQVWQYYWMENRYHMKCVNPACYLKNYISANCITLQATVRKFFIYCMFIKDLSLGFPDWPRQWRAAATERTSSSVLSLNTARSWGFITTNCIYMIV